MGLVLDVARTVDVAVAIDPAPGSLKVRLEVVIELEVARPAQVFGAEYKEENRGVDGAVKEPEGYFFQPGQLSGVHLVHDLARLLVVPWVLLLALALGQ